MMKMDKAIQSNHLADFVGKNFDSFKTKEGSQHIATFSSQLNFLENFCKLDVSNILDFGSGIGTFVPIMLTFSKAQIVAVEKNAWCMEQFEINMSQSFPDFKTRVHLVSEIISAQYDIVVIDDDISRKELHMLLKSRRLKYIFIEGWRNRTVSHISKRLPFFGYSAEFVRGNSRLQDFSRLGKHGIHREKAGSWFLLEQTSLVVGIYSWIIRLHKTKEITKTFKEFFYFVLRKLNIRQRFTKLYQQI